jgi:hypothetical protein
VLRGFGVWPVGVPGRLRAGAIAGAGIVTGAVCGAATICWASWSENPVYLGALLLALRVPVFYVMRRRNFSPDPDATARPA